MYVELETRVVRVESIETLMRFSKQALYGYALLLGLKVVKSDSKIWIARKIMSTNKATICGSLGD